MYALLQALVLDYPEVERARNSLRATNVPPLLASEEMVLLINSSWTKLLIILLIF